jgi:two-component system, chemotaxis family, chemotaxis protein CheY
MAKILVVDDSAFARFSIKNILESGGHEVIGNASDGKQALDLFESLRPELVTLDYLMDGMSGQEVLEELMQRDSKAKVIMISGSGCHSLEENALRAGAKFFLEKPFVQKRVLKAIDLALQS